MTGLELLTRYRLAGSEAAFSDLLRQFTGLVYSIAKRRVTDPSLAEDVTQTVFMRLAKAPPKLQTEGELVVWLHRTTTHVAIDAWRSETRRRARETEAVLMQTAPDDDARLWEEMTPHLDEALDQLPDEDRQAVLLRFFEQKPMRAIGDIFCVSEDAAKMRVKRAIERLRDQLGQRGIACTIVVLPAVLTQRSVEAAPAQVLAGLLTMRLAEPGAAGVAESSNAMLQMFRSKVFLGTASLVVLVSLLMVFQRRIDSQEVRTGTVPQTTPTPKPLDARRAKFFSKPDFTKRPLAPVVQQAPRFILRAIDKETGFGLAGAKIRVAYFYVGGAGEGHTVHTDQEGNGPIPEPNHPEKEPGMNLFVSIAGYVPKVIGLRGQDTHKDYLMELEPAVAVGGTVVDEQGTPVAGVEVKGQRATSDPHRMDAPSTDFQTCPVTTDAGGRWVFPYVPKSYNEMKFYLACTNFAVARATVPVSKSESLNATLVIKRGFALLGQVVNAEGRPVAGATVKEQHQFAFRKLSATTDQEGHFVMLGLGGPNQADVPSSKTDSQTAKFPLTTSEPKMDFVVQADGLAPQEQTVQFREPTNYVRFVLSRGSIFRGRVVNEDGNPIPGAAVRTDFDFKNQLPNRFSWLTNTGPDGRFEWNSAPAEAICFWFEAKGYKVIRGFPILPDGTDHEIKLKREIPTTSAR